MDMLKITSRIAASGLDVQARRLVVVSENIANSKSTGMTPGSFPYQRKTITFDAAIDEASGATFARVGSIDHDPRPPRLEHQPQHPAADAAGNVKYPNVDPLTELTDFKEANRAYQANLQVIRQVREMANATIDLLRA
jgi:flagellar basal-body rod protein FlgC